MLTSIPRFILHHWQGRVALLPAALGISLTGTIGLCTLSRTQPNALWLGGLIAFVMIWQTVGVLRAIRRQGHGGDIASWTAYAALVISVGLFLETELNRFAARQPAVLPHQAKKIPALEVHNKTAYLSEDITYETLARLHKTVAENPAITTLNLTSDGGLIPAARAIAVQIEKHGLATTTDSLCASACTLIFLPQMPITKSLQAFFSNQRNQTAPIKGALCALIPDLALFGIVCVG